MERLKIHKTGGSTNESSSEFEDLTKEIPDVTKINDRLDQIERERREEEEREEESSGRCGCF